MRFVCSEPYRTFRGYVFANGHPVTVTDKGTLEAIQREPNFTEFTDESDKAKIPAASSETTCPKCGGSFGRGMTMHVRWCKGYSP